MSGLGEARRPGNVLVTGVIALCVMLLSGQPVRAQGAPSWSRGEAISLPGETPYHPALVADARGRLHAVWAAARAGHAGEEQAILYARWQDGTWSDPIDIFLLPGRDAVNPRILVDSAGRLQLLWGGATPFSPFTDLYHSWAPVDFATSPAFWATPYLVEEGTNQSDIAEDPDGVLYLVYAHPAADNGICLTTSHDHGDTWEAKGCLPRWVPLRPDEAEARPRLELDSQGTLHLVWVLDDYSPQSSLRYSGRGVYYARSTDGGAIWTDMRTVEEVDGRSNMELTDQPEWPEIVVDHNDWIHLVWISGAARMQRVHQISRDGGVTWSQPEVAIPVPYYNGWMGLAVDGDNTLHFVTAGRDGVWYSRWYGLGWTPAVEILNDGEAPHYVSAAVLLGNQVHAIWMDHGGGANQDGEERIRHAWAMTGAPEATPAPPAQSSAGLVLLPTPTPVPGPTTAPTPAPDWSARLAPPIAVQLPDPNLPLAAAIVPAFVITALVLFLHILRR